MKDNVKKKGTFMIRTGQTTDNCRAAVTHSMVHVAVETVIGLIDLVNTLITHFLDHCVPSPFNNSKSQAKAMPRLKESFSSR